MILILFLSLVAFICCGFYFTMTTKELPKTWYQWKTEFRYQYIGIVGLIHDSVNRKRNRVAIYPQPSRVAVITGGNRGIGLQVVAKLLACEMTVIMGVRDPKIAEDAVADIVNLKSTKGKLICEKLNTADMKSVEEFAGKIKVKYNKIDILINNAGIMFAPYYVTNDGFESHLAVNYLGHFLLTHLLWPELQAAGNANQYSRIVNVSSCVHMIGRINYNDINSTKYYYPATAYSQSKLAQVLSSRHQQQILQDSKAPVQVVTVHPGIVDTDLFEHSATTFVPFAKKFFFKTPEQGARSVVFAAIDSKIEGKGGLYLSNCVKAPMHPAVKIPSKCEKLFQFTCNLLKIENFGSGRI